MKAFVSYSFKDSELYVVTLLFEQLRKSGYVVETSTFGYTTGYDLKIKKSDVFIGIITNNSGSIDYVIKEWSVAKHNNINNILIIEDGVKVANTRSLNFVRFSRRNPNPAIEKLFNIKKHTSVAKTTSTDAFEGLLIAAGIIVGIAALISLLSGGKK